MPSVQLSQETFERVCAIAAQQGRTPSEVVEQSLEALVLERERTPEQRKREWDDWYQSIARRLPAGLNEDEVFDELEAAANEARVERLARGR